MIMVRLLKLTVICEQYSHLTVKFSYWKKVGYKIKATTLRHSTTCNMLMMRVIPKPFKVDI